LKIFQRCKLRALITQASGFGFTSKPTHEFQVLTPVGEDRIVFCPKCGFSQNKEIAKVKEGDKCPKCGSILEESRGIEVGNIFPLETKYSKSIGLYFRDRNGQRKPVVMGSYGIGLGRLMATIVEIHHDEDGIIWPKEVAPFFIHIVPVEIREEEIAKTSFNLYQSLQNSGIEVLYDDRQEKSPGEKFVESDLIGIPIRIVISKKTLLKNEVEIVSRKDKKKNIIPLNEVQKYISSF